MNYTPLTHAPTSFQLQPTHQPQLYTQSDAKFRPPSQAKASLDRAAPTTAPSAQITPHNRDRTGSFAPRSHRSHQSHRLYWDRTPGSHRDCTNHSFSQSGAIVLRWYWSISYSLFLLLLIWSDLMNFFWLGFVSFVFIYWEMVLYICLEAEKMWETSRKCVFYIIFKNTTKH